MLHQKRLSQAICLEREFILLICSLRVQITAVHQIHLHPVFCFYVRLLLTQKISIFYLLGIWSQVIIIPNWQVALGEMSELLVADYNANQLPPGKLRFLSNFKLYSSWSEIFNIWSQHECYYINSYKIL